MTIRIENTDITVDLTPHATVPILVNVYGTTPVPAATFNQGARDIAEIQQATQARSELAENPAPRRDSR
jgi:hypothetical protein